MTTAIKTKQPGTDEMARDLSPHEAFAERKRELAVDELEACRKLISDVDTADRESWKDIVSALLTSGFTQSELEEELAASANTIYKWRTGLAAPREMTRRLLRKAVLEMVDERVVGIRGGM